MNVITVHQPFAFDILTGSKIYETRSWKTNIRGKIAIHASKNKTYVKKLYGENSIDNFTYGAIIGTTNLIDCIPVEKIRSTLSLEEFLNGDYSDGRYAWKTKNPRLFLEPVYIKGKQGWWNWDSD